MITNKRTEIPAVLVITVLNEEMELIGHTPLREGQDQSPRTAPRPVCPGGTREPQEEKGDSPGGPGQHRDGARTSEGEEY